MHGVMFMPNQSTATRAEEQGREGSQICSRICLVEAERPGTRRSPPPEETEKGLKEEARHSKHPQKTSGQVPPPGPRLTSPSLLSIPSQMVGAPQGQPPNKRLRRHKASKAENCFSRLQP